VYLIERFDEGSTSRSNRPLGPSAGIYSTIASASVGALRDNEVPGENISFLQGEAQRANAVVESLSSLLMVIPFFLPGSPRTTAVTLLLLEVGASAGKLPQYEVAGLPISPHQLSVLGMGEAKERLPTPTLTLNGMPSIGIPLRHAG
jgi:hypothetical protein